MIPYRISESAIAQMQNNMQDCKYVSQVSDMCKVLGVETYFGDDDILPEDLYADLMVLLVNKDDEIQNEKRFVFYNSLISEDEAVVLDVDMWGLPWTSNAVFVRFDRLQNDVVKIKLFLHIFQSPDIKEVYHLGQFDFVRYRAFISDEECHLNDDFGSTIIQREIEINLTGNTILEIGYFLKNEDKWDYVVDENAYNDDLIKYIQKHAAFSIE